MTQKRQAAEAILNELISVVRESLIQAIERVLESNAVEITSKPINRLKRAVDKPEGVSQDVWHDWLVIRRDKKLPLTPTAWEKIVQQIKQSGLTEQEAIEICCEKGWAGFQASWLEKEKSISGFVGDI